MTHNPQRPVGPTTGGVVSADDLFATIAAHRAGWMKHANCHGLTALMFPTQGEPVDQAKAVCATCPVVAPCAEAAVRNKERHGVWGGKAENDRRKDRHTLRGVA